MTITRIALVTGANQGVGLQVAKELVANGVTVLLGSRDIERGEVALGRSAPAPRPSRSTSLIRLQSTPPPRRSVRSSVVLIC